MKPGQPEGHFIAGSAGRIFVFARRPNVPLTGCVLVIPPFAEEQNKCRRMVAITSLRLAELGVATVVPDLFGTGDSEGDFRDANWGIWRDDIRRTYQWCHAMDMAVTSILAIRLGCALACDVAGLGHLSASRTVVWQPALNGERALVQFLRLRVAASLASSGPKESVDGLRKQLEAGKSVDVAGYEVSAALGCSLAGIMVPSRLPGELGVVDWIEVMGEEGAKISAPSKVLIENTRADGGDVREICYAGAPFWSSTEIVVNPEVVNRTVSAFIQIQPSADEAATTSIHRA